MCAIAGIITQNRGQPESEHRVGRMLTAMQHRGPDAGAVTTLTCGEYTITLGHRRLAIVDLDPRSNQPFASADGQIALVYNGEVFNYIELRKELQGLGHTFQTQSDTEVVLRAYEAWGEGALARFRGMWAFCLVDLRRRRLFLSRDHFGIKPLYLSEVDGALVFSSEIKGVLAAGLIAPAANEAHLSAYLSGTMPDASTATFFQGIQQLPQGGVARLNLFGNSALEHGAAAWSAELNPLTDTEASRRMFGELDDAVSLRLRSDVPVGCSLSGGMDSTSVAMLMAGRGAQVKSFSCIYGDPMMDESSAIQAASKRLNGVHSEFAFEREATFSKLLAMLKCQDEPVHSPSVLAQYLVYERMAAAGVKVSLDGQGGDELFAGYDFMVQAYYLNAWKNSEYATVAAGLLCMMRGNRAGAIAILRRIKSGRHKDTPPLAQVLAAAVARSTLPAALRYTDRNAMAHSVESRPPLLDQSLYLFSRGVPERMMVRRGVGKHIMRDAMRHLLPPEVVDARRKVGFWRMRVPELRTHARELMDIASGQDNPEAREARRGLEDLTAGKPVKNERAVWLNCSAVLWREVCVKQSAACALA